MELIDIREYRLSLVHVSLSQFELQPQIIVTPSPATGEVGEHSVQSLNVLKGRKI